MPVQTSTAPATPESSLGRPDSLGSTYTLCSCLQDHESCKAQMLRNRKNDILVYVLESIKQNEHDVMSCGVSKAPVLKQKKKLVDPGWRSMQA